LPSDPAVHQHSKARIHLPIDNGIVLVGSDGHYWPGPAPTAHRAFVKFCKEAQPRAVIMNGDAFDGASISRHPSIGWEKIPTVIEELEAVKTRLGEVEDAAPAKAVLTWPAGNHDLRFETRLAMVANQYGKIRGFHLHDHFSPRWKACWATWINEDTVVKHRAKRNAVRFAGKSMILAHTHSSGVSAFTDYTGTRWEANSGSLADPNGPQFLNYSEDNAKDHRAGFLVLTIHRKRLLWPEIVHVVDEKSVAFRGSIIRV
jgi:hypothetical protein